MGSNTMPSESFIGGTDRPTGDTAASGRTSSQSLFAASRASKQCPLAGFFLPGDASEITGISLVHMASQDTAEAGDLITFTAWILNATTEALTDVSLHLRSFTNEAGEQLEYRTEPCPTEMTGRTLGPRQALTFCFSYEVTQRDLGEPGLLISALRADLVAPNLGRIYSECDALVSAVVHSALPLP